jgi:signal transduction histidine kinase/CHASE3 domain sensor protein
MPFSMPNRKNWLIAGFIAAVVALLVAFLLILSYRSRTILAQLGGQADQAIDLGDKIQATVSREVTAIVGFQATGQTKYIELYQEHADSVDNSLEELEPLVTFLGPSVQRRFKDLKSAIDKWHQDEKTNLLASRRLPSDEFRQVVFDRLFLIGQVHETTAEFNKAVLAYESAQRESLERQSILFRTLAIVFGPLALLALMLIVHILRRLDTATSHLESQAREEQALRRVGQCLTGGLTVGDVLDRITQAAAISVETEGVFIETVDTDKTEITCVAANGTMVPAKGAKGPYEGSIAQEVLRAQEPEIIQNPRRTAISELALGGPGCVVMVVPLIADNQGLGAIFLIRPHPRFTQEELRKVRIFADMASLALQRALTLERVRKMEDQARFSTETLKTLSSSLDYKTTLKAVARLALSELADFCVILLIEEGRIQVAELAHRDPAKRDILQSLQNKYRPRPDLTNSVEHVIQMGEPMLTREVTDELLKEYSIDNEHFDLLRQLNLKSSMVVPLTADSEIFGTIVLLRGGRSYEADDLMFAQEIARYAALAIRNARLYAQASDAIHARDEVLRVVSHDLQNPVSNIQLSVKLLTDPSVPEEKRQGIVQMIIRSAERMRDLIEDLIAISRMHEGQKIPLNVQPQNPADIIDEACAGVGFQVAARSIDFRCSKPETLPTIKADRRRILQVLYNLLDNALKFTPDGGSIVVSGDRRDGEVQISVKDTGHGIEPKNVTKIFDLFWQAKPGAHLGSGLGLAIAKGIVEQHNGRIWAESKLGLGTTISFTLPRADIGEKPVSPKAA